MKKPALWRRVLAAPFLAITIVALVVTDLILGCDTEEDLEFNDQETSA